MILNDIKQEIERLRDAIERLNHNYYVLNNPTVDDGEYDRLLAQLSKLEAQHPEFNDPNSPTQRVGSDVTNSFVQMAHLTPMLSLSNTYSVEEIEEFIGRVERAVGTQADSVATLFGPQLDFCCELKFDGTAISLWYENGHFVRALTRGDGSAGDDVSANVRTIRTIPMTLQGDSHPAIMEVRGEIYMPHSSFERLNAERIEIGDEPFANPRNAAAGTLKQQSSAVVASRGLECVLYGVASAQPIATTHFETLARLGQWGFRTSDAARLCRSIDEIKSYIKFWDTERHNLPYDTDGVVIKLDSVRLQRDVGSTAKSPRWAVAYKFKAEQAATRLLSVDFQVGRTGAITPVANLDPVLLSGTTVRRASLHNAEQIQMLDIRVGDMVLVEKGGEIIPKIVGVQTANRPANLKPLEYITHCPECDAQLAKAPDEAKHYCPNATGCPPQIIGRIVHFIGRKSMNIDGLGEETVMMLYNSGLVRNPADLYDLTIEQLMPLDRIAQRSAERIVESVLRSREVPYARLLFAIGIRHVGETTAKKLANAIPTIVELAQASREQLLEVEEVGSIIADSIIDYFKEPLNVQMIERLTLAGLQTTQVAAAKLSESLDGLKIVISGTFEHHSRPELKSMIEQHGGTNQTSVSKATNYLLAGDGIGPKKLETATKLGVKIISEKEFLEMIQSV